MDIFNSYVKLPEGKHKKKLYDPRAEPETKKTVLGLIHIFEAVTRQETLNHSKLFFLRVWWNFVCSQYKRPANTGVDHQNW